MAGSPKTDELRIFKAGFECALNIWHPFASESEQTITDEEAQELMDRVFKSSRDE